MDTQITVALITGIFGAVITPVVNKVLTSSTKVADKPGSDGTKSTNKRVFWQAVIGGIIGVPLGYLLGYLLVIPTVLSPCPFFKPTSVTITSPTSGSNVPQLVTVQGTACHIPNDKELWLLVVSNGEPGYYPQSGPIVVSSDDKWSVSAYIGSNQKTDVGAGFTLIPALADQEGSAALQTYLTRSGSEVNSLDPLPKGIQLMNQELVIRK